MKRSLTLLTLLLQAACSPTTATETAVSPQPTAITSLPSPTQAEAPTSPAPEQATAAPAESEAVDTPIPATEEPIAIPTEVVETGVVYGRTPEGAFFQGFADAPITLIDYSDFL
jgi:hypothetical protein